MTSILGDLDNYAYSIGVDYRLLTADEATNATASNYGKVKYSAVEVVCIGTKEKTVFESGDFKVDFEQALKFAETKVAEAVSAGHLAKAYQYIVISRTESLNRFLELNSKYELANPVRDAITSAV